MDIPSKDAPQPKAAGGLSAKWQYNNRLCDFDTLERRGHDVKHRLLRLNQGINTSLKRVGGRVVGDVELLLGGLAGRLMLLRVIIESFL